MSDFFKTIRLSLRYKWSLLGSIVCALGVACLWGASIWTVYPLVEVVFEGKTIQTWVDAKIESAQGEVDRLRDEISDLKAKLRKASDPDRGVFASRIALRRDRIALCEKSRRFYSSMRPYIRRWGPSTPFGTLTLVIVLLLVATALKGICLVLNVVLVSRVTAATVSDMRRIFFRQLLRLDHAKIERTGTTKLMTMLSHNVRLVQQGLGAMYGKSVREPLKIIACLVLACAISWQLLLLSLLAVPIGGVVVYLLGQRMKGAAFGEIRGFTALFEVLLESLNGIKLVRIYAGQRRQRLRFEKAARSLSKMQVRMSFFDSLIRPINEITAIGVLSIAVLCGAFLVLSQQTHLFGLPISSRPLTASEMFTFFAMLAGIADPARKLSDIYNVMLRAVLINSALYSTFEKPPKITRSADPKPAPLHQKSIRFENVTFAYDPGSPVLNRVNLKIPYGQTIALVGANGSGKSTIANLMARFYDPKRGNIYLDGVNLRDIRPSQLRKQIGIVTQDPFLFDDTILSNVRYGRQWASDNEVRQSAETAHVIEVMRKIPNPFKANVGEGGRALSGGQRQRVALARAILKDPRILILDEATSQLDAPTEVSILESLREFLKQRTTILITHRLSTLALAHRVVVFHDGSIVKDLSANEVHENKQNLSELLARAA